jgi:hypothetical protein
MKIPDGDPYQTITMRDRQPRNRPIKKGGHAQTYAATIYGE